MNSYYKHYLLLFVLVIICFGGDNTQYLSFDTKVSYKSLCQYVSPGIVVFAEESMNKLYNDLYVDSISTIFTSQHSYRGPKIFVSGLSTYTMQDYFDIGIYFKNLIAQIYIGDRIYSWYDQGSHPAKSYFYESENLSYLEGGSGFLNIGANFKHFSIVYSYYDLWLKLHQKYEWEYDSYYGKITHISDPETEESRTEEIKTAIQKYIPESFRENEWTVFEKNTRGIMFFSPFYNTKLYFSKNYWSFETTGIGLNSTKKNLFSNFLDNFSRISIDPFSFLYWTTNRDYKKYIPIENVFFNVNQIFHGRNFYDPDRIIASIALNHSVQYPNKRCLVHIKLKGAIDTDFDFIIKD
ncbi:MAG: hypothetical protein ACP5FZ_11235, partial [Fidelibacterota bacterium]